MRTRVKLSKWAEMNGLKSSGAYNMFKKGGIPNAIQLPTGTILVDITDEMSPTREDNTVIYARVSTPKQKDDLNSQVTRLQEYSTANGWQVKKVYKEIASGLNDNRPILTRMLNDQSITRIIVEHKDRLTRFGFNYINLFLQHNKCDMVVVNVTDTDQDSLMEDFVNVITSMAARVYGLRRSKRKTEKFIDILKQEELIND